jgi:hypothetical protein
MFAQTIPTQKAPEIGMFCSVDVTVKHHSNEFIYAQILTIATLGFLPSSSGGSGFIVRYDLYIDGDLKKSYRYEVKRTLLVWLGFLPFVWMNALTPSQGEAVASTAYQFFYDARQDAFF